MIKFDALRKPVSAELPCGPDLEMAGDPNFMNCLARLEGQLPESFFSFERASIDFDAEIAALGSLLERTRDLRLLTLAAKLHVLNRDTNGFIDSIDLIADLVAERWEDLHPQIQDGDASLRGAVLQTLDDMPNSILPLQYAPLVESRRAGTISYRNQMIAAGEVKKRDGEEAPDAAAIEHALMETDLPALVSKRDEIRRLPGAISRIRLSWIQKAGFENAPSFERLAPLAEKIGAFLEQAIIKRDPAAGLKEPAQPGAGEVASGARAGVEAAASPPPAPQGGVASAAAASSALAAAAGYFERREPSTPALLLVRQAEQLIGKSFLDVMRIMVPDAVPKAEISVGAEQPVAFPLERFEALSATVERRAGEDGEPVPTFEAPGRNDALQLLGQVATFYRAAEPTSPIPLLIDRARALAHMDFMSLLKEIAPKRK